MEKGQRVKTSMGEGIIIRVENVYGSYSDRIAVEFPDGNTSQFNSVTVTLIQDKL
jgi:hypothetical protein